MALRYQPFSVMLNWVGLLALTENWSKSNAIVSRKLPISLIDRYATQIAAKQLNLQCNLPQQPVKARVEPNLLAQAIIALSNGEQLLRSSSQLFDVLFRSFSHLFTRLISVIVRSFFFFKLEIVSSHNYLPCLTRSKAENFVLSIFSFFLLPFYFRVAV